MTIRGILLALVFGALAGCGNSGAEGPDNVPVDPSASTPSPSKAAGEAKQGAKKTETGFGATSAAADLESRMGTAGK